MGLGYDGNVPDIRHAIPHREGLQHVTRGITSMRGSHPSERGIFSSPEGAPLMPPQAGDVIDRMRVVVGVNTDIELAERLKLGRSAPSNWRSRNKIPTDECLALAVEHGVSLDWLLFGRGSRYSAVGNSADDGSTAPADHVELLRLREFDTTSGPERLMVPELIIRHRAPNADVVSLRWMINPAEGLAPRLPKGAPLLVDISVKRHEDVVDGDTYVVRMWGRINVRRIFIIGPNEYRLRGESEVDERRDLTGPDYQHLEIGGRVIDVI